MGFFNIKGINWKYIFGEIFLLFVGINLAIWFNNWNTSKGMEKDKVVALEKIEGEIKANLDQLVKDHEVNQKIPSFFSDFDALEAEDGRFVTSPETMGALQKKYPEYIREVDSTEVGDGQYAYRIDSYINLEITDLSSIAWEISKSTGIFHEFGYDCLYDLQSLYNTQDLVKNELNKATEALRNTSMKDLVRTLGILKQLEEQLEKQYRDMLQNIKDCR
ncbi:hypothetical protein EZV76_15095 [Flagellimonas alvinocaridis]|uniref:Uncharacterized protein n=1 Tax=Flagellimonas alvinocaridis TaxID=2530200 RepID=A0A4S8RQJ5_9FLAO|nr:hypothetical protein [Allomuricauda alvinocaridis]THV57319.1 hypothetical protein EZV76_15095 [Allomuricauda alvinocaridis]